MALSFDWKCIQWLAFTLHSLWTLILLQNIYVYRSDNTFTVPEIICNIYVLSNFGNFLLWFYGAATKKESIIEDALLNWTYNTIGGIALIVVDENRHLHYFDNNLCYVSAAIPYMIVNFAIAQMSLLRQKDELKKKKNVVTDNAVGNVANIKHTAGVSGEVDQSSGAYALGSEDKTTGPKEPHQCAGCAEKDIQLLDWEAKYKQLLKVYMNQSHHFSELTIKHNVLLATKSNCPDAQPDDTATNASAENIFSPTELKILQNMSLCKSKDSTFIRQCLEYAYKNDMALLSVRTLKGKSESVKFLEDGQKINIPKKDPLSPEKVSRIKELFIERIIKCKIDSVSFESRIKESNIHKLIASSIKNISNKNV